MGTILILGTLLLLLKTNLGATGDSLRYLTPQDTIFISTGAYGQKMFVHTMEPQQTLYSLSRFYGLTLDELYFYNPKNEGGRYGVGSQINIPIPNRSIIRYRPEDYSDTLYVPLYYVVQKGETMYHIPQRLFQLPTDALIDRNSYVVPTFSVGQKLKIGCMSIKGEPAHISPSRG